MRNPFPKDRISDEQWDAVLPGYGTGYEDDDGDIIFYGKPISERTLICVDPERWQDMKQLLEEAIMPIELLSNLRPDQLPYLGDLLARLRAVSHPPQP